MIYITNQRKPHAINLLLIREHTDVILKIYVFFPLCQYDLLGREIQLTFEQHGFELCGSSYTCIFFNKYILQYYMIRGCLNPRMWNHRYGGMTVKLHGDFWLRGGSGSQPPSCSRVNCIPSTHFLLNPYLSYISIIHPTLVNIQFA